MDLVSIVIPAYNAQAYLRETVDSALKQTYGNCEVIVVDDGSVDDTPRILAEYGGKIRVVRQTNRGSAAACNAGVAVAKGTWVCFLDADDVWLPDKVARQLEVCGDKAISHTDSVLFGDALNGEILRSSFEPLYSGRVLDKLLVINFISKSTVMIRRDVYNRFGGFDETYVTVEDWPLWLKVCAEYDLGYLSEPLVRYRVHRKSKSMLSRRVLNARLRVIEEAFSEGGAGHSLPQIRGPALASAYQVSFHYAGQSGDWKLALACAVQALRYKPADARKWKNLIKAILMPLGMKY